MTMSWKDLIDENNIQGCRRKIENNPESMNQEFLATFDTFRPLVFASYRNNLEIINLLLRYGVDVNGTDQYGDTALHYACYLGYSDIVSVLLNHPNIRVDIRNNYGSTPLHYACQYSYVDIVNLLISLVVNKYPNEMCTYINMMDKFGTTALMLSRNNREITDCLKKQMYCASVVTTINATPNPTNDFNDEIQVLKDELHASEVLIESILVQYSDIERKEFLKEKEIQALKANGPVRDSIRHRPKRGVI